MAKKPKGGAAVMEGRAGDVVDGDTPEMALHRKLNFFPTPPWAGRAGAELIRRVAPGARSIEEPACGQGHLAEVLGESFPTVHAWDIHPFGYGGVGDYLGPDSLSGVDVVATNPPFKAAEAFIAKALRTARLGAAMLCRSNFEETTGRHALMRRLAVKAPFSERVAMSLGGWDPGGDTMTAYSWFVWLTEAGLAECPLGDLIRSAHAAGGYLTLPIGPGTKARLTRHDDARRFGRMAAAPLFEVGP